LEEGSVVGLEVATDHALRIEEVQEALLVHLVRVLRKHLPDLEERRHVLHLPPEVEGLVVDGGHGSILTPRSEYGVVDRGRVHECLGRRRRVVEERVDGAVHTDGHTGAADSVNLLRIGEVLLDEFLLGDAFVLVPEKHLHDGLRAEELRSIVLHVYRLEKRALEVAWNSAPAAGVHLRHLRGHGEAVVHRLVRVGDHVGGILVRDRPIEAASDD